MNLARVVAQALWRTARPPIRVDLVVLRAAFVRAEEALPKPAKKRPKRIRKPAVTVPELPPSDWDPEPIRAGLVGPTPYRDEERVLQDVSGSKALLLEIIRRTAYDWVLYRTSTRLLQKILAEQAYQWLFVEVPGTPDWAERLREKKYITSFIAICEGLDLDPDTVRGHIKRLTPKHVMSVGRPAEYRRRDLSSAKDPDAEVYSLPGGMVESVESTLGEDDGSGGGGEEF